MPAMTEDRRPIAARGWALSARVAGRIARRGVGADAVSLAGLGCGLSAGAAFALTSVWPSWILWLAAGALVQLRLAANMLDGMVAEQRGGTALGPLWNEVPDRISDAAILVGLGYAAGGSETLGYLAALAAVLVAYVRAVGKALSGRQDFRGPMAKQQRMVVATLAAVLAAIWTPHVAAGPGLAAIALAVVTAGSAVTAARRLVGIARTLRGGTAGA
jgi:phosphatidylglycerophosphate synthase